MTTLTAGATAGAAASSSSNIPQSPFPSFVLPGQPIAPSSRYLPGTGVHIFNGHITSALVGQVSLSSDNRLSVVKPKLNADKEEGADATLLPDVGSEVLARVNRINQRQATVGVFVVNGRICGDEFQGVIRLQDVRATEVDKVKIFTSFRPGDIVRARVISLGDQSNYYLSTASNNLGVIMANSEAGDPMYPSSWIEMKSTRTGAVELRKVAKPF